MSFVYFAKFNINEKIYDVYSDEKLRKQILFKIYDGMNTNLSIVTSNGTYKFLTPLFKEPESWIVNGRIVHYGPGVHTRYDDSVDDVTEEFDDKKATYVSFSFDIKNEIIGFVPRRDFGYKQFMKRFKDLIEKSTDIGEVQIFLENDIEKLEERLLHLESVNEINVRLIPPNNDREDFKALFSTDADDVEESGATRFFFRLLGSSKKGLNVSSNYIKKLIRAVGLGYGVLTAKGKNRSGEKVRIVSDQDTPFIRPIDDLQKENIPVIQEKTQAGIRELQILKVQRRMMSGDEEHSKEQE